MRSGRVGWSYQRIADRAGVSRAALHRWVHDAGSATGRRAYNAPQAATGRHMAPKHHRATLHTGRPTQGRRRKFMPTVYANARAKVIL